MKIDELISEIKKNINSGNRGNCDYFIVDEIENLIDEYEKSGGCEKCNDHSEPERAGKDGG